MFCKIFRFFFPKEEKVKQESETTKTLIAFTAHVDVSKVTTGNGLEKTFRRLSKNPHTLVQRADYKNNVPDYLVSNKRGEFVYVECKFYGSLKHKTWVDVMKAYAKKQPKQYEAFRKLAKHTDVYFFLVARKGMNSLEPKARLIRFGYGHVWERMV